MPHNPEVVAAAMESIARRHHDYLIPIQNTHSLAKTAADRLKVGGEIEQLFKELGRLEPEWLQTQRQRLLQLGTINDEMTVQVGTFVTAVRGLADNNNSSSETNDGDDGEVAATQDYELILQQGMQDQPSAADKNSITNHDMAKEMRSKLELPPEEQEEQDEDQELQVVGGSGGNAASSSRLKCPLTGTLLEDPVKNSVCGHAYSKAAILDHLSRARGKVCPMVGCQNRQVTTEQLVPDLELTQLVRRYKRRSDANKEHRLTQVLEDDDEEDDSDLEDDNENHDGNTTRAVKREKAERLM
jgi:hypothetical protein